MNKINPNIKTILTRIRIAMLFITILPFKRSKNYDADDIGHSVIYFPFVGFLLGTICALLNIALTNHLPSFIKDCIVLSIMLTLTGGIHLEGFVDMMDNILKTDVKSNHLEFTKEIGITGIIAIYTTILILSKFLIFNQITENFKNSVLILFPMLSRLSMVFSIFLTEHYKNTSSFNTKLTEFINLKELIIMSMIPIIITILIMKISGIILISILFLFTYFLNLYFLKNNKKIKDIFGAITEIAEIIIISFFAIFIK